MIVDDEALARTRLKRLVALEEGTELVAEAGTVKEAVRLVGRVRPDILLLDIKMPGGDGFDVLDALTDPPPAVVFVTAYEDHALRAFDVEAVDYLLKPFDGERFRTAFNRARRRLARRADMPSPDALREILARVRAAESFVGTGDRLLARSGQRIDFVSVADVDWIEGAGNYARLHVGDASHLVRVSLSDLERRLSARGFARIHRSTIVNLDRVRKLSPSFVGEYAVVLQDGTKLKLSRGYQDKLQSHLKSLF
jgi:two-component system LytT family response regulator